MKSSTGFKRKKITYLVLKMLGVFQVIEVHYKDGIAVQESVKLRWWHPIFTSLLVVFVICYGIRKIKDFFFGLPRSICRSLKTFWRDFKEAGVVMEGPWLMNLIDRQNKKDGKGNEIR